MSNGSVEAGEAVAISGNTGSSTGSHLHFQLQWGNDKYKSYNPLETYHPNDQRSTWTNPNPLFIYYESIGAYFPNHILIIRMWQVITTVPMLAGQAHRRFSMKKLTAIIILLSMLMCVGCGNTPSSNSHSSANSSPPHTDNTLPSTTSPTVSGTNPTIPEVQTPPEYCPGSILLQDQDDDDYDFQRKYRISYYRVWGEYMALLNAEEQVDASIWLEQESKRTKFGELQEEMLLVSLIKRYNITREEFDIATSKFEKYWGDKGYTNWEEYEVPNGDIIYTFDNEVINHFYRYE